MSPDQVRHPPVVTLSALYGAGGSVVGPRVAERLGVPLLDRQIRHDVADRTGVPEKAVADLEEGPRGAVGRLVASLGRASTITGGPGATGEDLDIEERRLRGDIEEFLARSTSAGGVAIGRGGMVVLRTVAWALHVHLGGPRESRIEQGMALEEIDRETAQRRQETEDRTRIGYVRRAYGVDGEDPALYHLMLDSTALDLDTCVELIVAASQARTRHPRETPPA
jgi:cytidylate kinase